MKVRLFLLMFAVTLVVSTLNVSADFLCRADLSYKWNKTEKTPEQKPLQAKLPEKKLAEQKTPEQNAAEKSTPEVEDAPGFTVFWTQIEQAAATEDLAKAAVVRVSLSERSSAERACLSQHENLSGCIAGKYAGLATTLSVLSFSARKAMQEAIHADCEQQQGNCLGSNLSETKCNEFVPAGKVVETPVAAKDAKGKKK